MRLTFVLLAMAVLGGCSIEVHPSGPPESFSKTIERDSSELVTAELKMGVGELRVAGGSKKLMEGSFDYIAPSWKPEVRYSNTGVRGSLTITQPEQHGSVGGNQKNRWDINFADDIAMDLNIKFGVGEAKLDLGSLNLRNVETDLGVGQITMDLRGEPKRDYDVHIRGGVGQATVYLPNSAGIYAEAHGGIGGIKVTGLKKQGDHWVNEAYDKAKVKVTVDVRGGIGEIRLIAD